MHIPGFKRRRTVSRFHRRAQGRTRPKLLNPGAWATYQKKMELSPAVGSLYSNPAKELLVVGSARFRCRLSRTWGL